MLRVKLNVKDSIFLLMSLLTVLFVSCESKKKQQDKAVVKKAIIDTFSKDSLEFNKNGFYPVFKISENITAIAFELGEFDEEDKFYNKIYAQVAIEDTIVGFDTDLNAIKPINSTREDTTSCFSIFHNQNLEKRIKEKMPKQLYLIGDKGTEKIKLSNVYVTYDECISSIIAVELEGYNKNKVGKPLFCSEKDIKLNFNSNYSKEKKMFSKYVSTLLSDYSNPKGSETFFANFGDFYFVYEDDFKWCSSKNNSKIDFPSRNIYKIDANEKVRLVYGKSLDLFGIPCD